MYAADRPNALLTFLGLVEAPDNLLDRVLAGCHRLLLLGAAYPIDFTSFLVSGQKICNIYEFFI